MLFLYNARIEIYIIKSDFKIFLASLIFKNLFASVGITIVTVVCWLLIFKNIFWSFGSFQKPFVSFAS